METFYSQIFQVTGMPQALLDLGDPLFGFERTSTDGAQHILVLANLTARSVTLDLDRLPPDLRGREDLLAGAFPFDTVEPVRKGARGADVIHTVRHRSGAVCGKIVWETKRAENWSNAWVGKLKDDQQAVGGELAVLVSTALPAGVSEPMTIYEGVWLVRPELVRAMAEALRTVLIESQRQKAIAVGRDESIDELYRYVTSAQFAQKIRAVIEACAQMRDDLEKEKAAMLRLWKKRESQIERASANMLGLCGELQGVSNEALPQLDDIGLLPP